MARALAVGLLPLLATAVTQETSHKVPPRPLAKSGAVPSQAPSLAEEALELAEHARIKLFDYMDVDQEGRVSLEEALEWNRMEPAPRDPAIIKKVFAAHDRDQDGFLNVHELPSSWTQALGAARPVPVALLQRGFHSISALIEKAENFFSSWVEQPAPKVQKVNCPVQCSALFSDQRPANWPTPPPGVTAINCVAKCEEAAENIRTGKWTTPTPLPGHPTLVPSALVQNEAHHGSDGLLQSGVSSVATLVDKAEHFVAGLVDMPVPTFPPVNCPVQCSGLFSPQRPNWMPTPPPDVTATNCVAKCEEAAENIRTGKWTTPTPFPGMPTVAAPPTTGPPTTAPPTTARRALVQSEAIGEAVRLHNPSPETGAKTPSFLQAKGF